MNASGKLSGYRLIETLAGHYGHRHCAFVSSFGADSAVLLHLAAQVDPGLPVLFIDTGMHFPQTLAYRDQLVQHLGLSDVRCVTPASGELSARDPDSTLHRSDPDSCCRLRKVLPLAAALDGFHCWFNGRKRFQGAARGELANAETEPCGRVRANPLFNWTQSAIEMYKTVNKLPRHPLEIHGYGSIGCRTCTRPGCNSRRDGRWAGSGKAECGIFFDAAGKPVRVGNQAGME